MKKELYRKLESAIYGLAIGDALGVPVEFHDRDSLLEKPVKDMRGYGMYMLPPGTFSDDTSLSLATLDGLAKHGYKPRKIANNFIKWLFKGKYAIDRNVFDVGTTTRKSILEMKVVDNPIFCGRTHEKSKGNGSLMRILPLAFYIKTKQKISESKVKELCYELSDFTHHTLECEMACHFYVKFALKLIDNKTSVKESYIETCDEFIDIYKNDKKVDNDTFALFDRILNKELVSLNMNDIKSSGYVIDSLEAAVWCLLTSNSYKETVLKAVNLGRDTDTIASISGGLAGIVYDKNGIPKEWIEKLRGKNIIKKVLFFSKLM